MYTKTTEQMTVKVNPVFLEHESDPEEPCFVWAYHVRIENHGTQPVRVCNRHWRITDSAGRTEEVRGAGVVGEQPLIEPGHAFEYVSGTPLKTPSGIMVGSYGVMDAGGRAFEIDIPAFSLDSPFEQVQVH